MLQNSTIIGFTNPELLGENKHGVGKITPLAHPPELGLNSLTRVFCDTA